MVLRHVPGSPEAILRVVLENLPGIVWTTDREFRCTSVFGAGLAALNITADQVVGKTLYEFGLAEKVTVDANAPIALAHRRALAGETAGYEQAGPNFIVQGAVRPLRDSDSRIVGCIGICQDVTARKRAEEALRESEQRYRAIVEETTEMIARFTPELILTYVNEAYCRFVGSTREKLVGKNLLCFVAEEHQTLTQTRLAQIRAERPICQNEELLTTPTGEVRWVHWVNRALVDPAGRVVEIQSAGRDITEQKAAEAQIQEDRENLEHLLNLYDQDRQLISYEIHDGLAQYLTGAQMQFDVARQLRDTDPEAAQRAGDVGQSLLAKSLQEARRLIRDLRPPVLEEAGAVAAIERLVHERREETGIRITFAHRADFPRLAAPLENAIFRIAQESVTNVIRHSQSDQCEIRLKLQGDQVHLEIQDRGVGFDPHSPRPGRFGLKGIQERAGLLGGKATIDSTPGQGARVVVVVPVL